jgi:AcrR family transcriptional regulator
MPPRPRATQDAILRATIDLIADHGVDGFSVDAVSAATGASKATIYRHWGSRAKLIHAAFERLQRPSVEPDTGSLREDLTTLLRQVVTYLNRRANSRTLSSLIYAAARDPELAELHRQNDREGRALFERAIRRGIDRGELPEDVDVRLLIDLLMSPFIYRRLVTMVSAKPADIAPIVDLLLAAFNRVPT